MKEYLKIPREILKTPTFVCHGRAIVEFLITNFISFLPIIIAVLVVWLTTENRPILLSLKDVIGGGELIIYTATTMAPVLYSAYRDPPIPLKPMFFIGSLVLVLLGTTYYSMYEAQLIRQDMYTTSLSVTFVALVILYANYFVNHKVQYRDPASEQAERTRKFATNYGAHRRKRDEEQQ